MATIETDLNKILEKIDNRLDRIEQKLEALPKMEVELSQLKDDVKDIKNRANAQIWTLIVAVVGALIAAIVRFSFSLIPKDDLAESRYAEHESIQAQ